MEGLPQFGHILSTPAAATPFKFISVFLETWDVVRLTSLRCRVTVVTTRPKEMLLASRGPARQECCVASVRAK